MQISCQLSAEDIRQAIADYVESTYGVHVSPNDVRVLVKSQQNYKSEWEVAHFKADFISKRPE
jgi:hypothetical protein